MNITQEKTEKVTKLWAEAIPAETTTFLVFSTDSNLRHMFVSKLVEYLDKNFLSHTELLSEEQFVFEMLDSFDLYIDPNSTKYKQTILGILNLLREHSHTDITRAMVQTLINITPFDPEFIVLDGWKYLEEIELIKKVFEYNKFIKIKLASVIDDNEASDLRSYHDFDVVFFGEDFDNLYLLFKEMLEQFIGG